VTEKGANAGIGDLVALIVHDLRNPVATISANVSFVREVAPDVHTDANEALDDVEIALGDLGRGLEQLGWVGRWLSGKSAADESPGDARGSIEEALRRVADDDVTASSPDEPVSVHGGGAPLARLIELLVRNSRQHAKGPIIVRLTPDAVIEIEDRGRSVGADLREKLFTLPGQLEIKTRVDGRYSRAVGLLAARALADAMSAELEVGGADGAAVFRVRLSPAG